MIISLIYSSSTRKIHKKGSYSSEYEPKNTNDEKIITPFSTRAFRKDAANIIKKIIKTKFLTQNTTGGVMY